MRKARIFLLLLPTIISLIFLMIFLYIKLYSYILYIGIIKKHIYIARFRSTLIKAEMPRTIVDIFVEDYKENIDKQIGLCKNLLSVRRIFYESIRLS